MLLPLHRSRDAPAGARSSGRTVSHVATLAVAVMAATLVAALDFVTGAELSFSVFYLLPIALLAWRFGTPGAVLASCAGAALWFGVERASGASFSHPLIPVWNAGVRLAFFLITSALLVRVRGIYHAEAARARLDALTGLLNPNEFRERADLLIEIASRRQTHVAVGFLDLDRFKELNDSAGHQEGDRALREVGNEIAASVRSSDVVGRLGGDEFGMVFLGTGPANAEAAFQFVHDRIVRLARARGWPLGVSIGVVVFHPPLRLDEALAAADAQMYRIKQTGGSGVSVRELADGPDGARLRSQTRPR